MRVPGRIGAALSILLLSGCVPRPAPPPPVPPPPPVQPAPLPPPPQPAVGWEDAPLTPGDWSLGMAGGRAAATYAGAAPLFVVRCEPDGRIALIRTAARGGALTIRTTYGARALPAAAGPEGLAAIVAAADPLLDGIAFSRGRFAVETEGQAPLLLPAWPEPARVVEDCRG